MKTFYKVGGTFDESYKIVKEELISRGVMQISTTQYLDPKELSQHIASMSSTEKDQEELKQCEELDRILRDKDYPVLMTLIEEPEAEKIVTGFGFIPVFEEKQY